MLLDDDEEGEEGGEGSADFCASARAVARPITPPPMTCDYDEFFFERYFVCMYISWI